MPLPWRFGLTVAPYVHRKFQIIEAMRSETHEEKTDRGGPQSRTTKRWTKFGQKSKQVRTRTNRKIVVMACMSSYHRTFRSPASPSSYVTITHVCTNDVTSSNVLVLFSSLLA